MQNITLQTQLNLNLIIIIIIIIVSFNNYFVKSQNSVNKIYKSCNATTQNIACGSETIKYPFYINGQQQPYCGHPNFQLSCENSADGPPLLNISGKSYTVNGIGYQNQTIQVTNAALSGNKYGLCIPPLTNLSLPARGALSLHQNQRKVYLLFGCNYTGTFSGGGTQSTCHYNSYYSVLALSDDFESRMAEVSETCGGMAPVEAPVFGSGSKLTAALMAGFVLDWDARLSVSCGDCDLSGGICGSSDTSDFVCYCRDGPSSDDSCGGDIVSPAPSQRLTPFHIDIVAPVPSLMPLRHGESITLVVKTGVPIGTVVAVSIISAVLLYCLRKKKRKQTKHQVLTKLRELGSLVTLYSYSDIKTMTSRFNAKLGSGGFGDVYKGISLKDNNVLVAVKVLKDPNTKHVLGQKKPRDVDQGLQSFVKEVAAVSAASHINIVKLLGFCYESGLWFEGTTRALVFEFMENGSLDKYLCDHKGKDNNNNDRQEVGFEKRYQIAIGIAKGLQYLHDHCNTSIVHFDIKPENILLDGNFVPKISDFGLAKTCQRDMSRVPISNPRGTTGFMPPEIYNRLSEVSDKCDVYSYGMMLIDILNLRQNPNSTNNDDEAHFPDWVNDRLESLLTMLSRNVNNEDQDKIKKEIIMIRVSLQCIQKQPSDRLAMGQVINKLEMRADDSIDVFANNNLRVACSSEPAIDELSTTTQYLSCL